ncbi:MAG: hypothetical protein MRY32_08040 [Rickettsiales bacterium]|nr:hypothetical protein [Rickettsiales bacterium]
MRAFIAFVATMLCAAMAHAVTVTNLDDKEHFVVFEATQGSHVVKSVKPGQIIRHMQPNGSVRLRDSGSPIYTQAQDRLTIWPKAGLVIQMRRKVDGPGL